MHYAESQLFLAINKNWWALLLMVLFIINCIFWEIQPTVWLDEVSYTDPAANLAAGNGFVSTAWYAQNDHSFWSGNVPLHQFLLTAWFRLFGFSEIASRIFSYFIMSVAIGTLVVALKRLGLLSEGGWLAVLTLMLFTLDGVSFSYRSGRPDAVTFLICAAQFFALSIQKSKLKYGLLFIIGALAPWAGLQIVVFLGIIWISTTLLSKGRLFPHACAAGAGVVFGIIALLLLYFSEGTLVDFWKSIRHHTLEKTIQSDFPIKQMLTLPFVDRSGAFILCGILVAFLCSHVRGNRIAQSYSILGACAMVFIPVLLFIAGTYKIYYSWMSLIPASILLVLALNNIRSKIADTLSISLIIAAILVGLPTRIVIASNLNYMQTKALSERSIKAEVRQDDIVLAHSKFFYMLKPQVKKVFFNWYLDTISPEEIASVTLMVVDPTSGPWLAEINRNEWKIVSEVKRPSINPTNRLLGQILTRAGKQQTSLGYDLLILRRERIEP